MPTTTRAILLAKRPTGLPEPDCFQLTELHLTEPAEGQVLVRNLWMSVDPYMRGRMDDRPSYVAPFALGEPLDGGAIGVVEISRSDDLAPGDLVLHGLGWREHAVLDAARARRIEPDSVPPQAHLGLLGVPGLTAYVGLVEIATMRPGESVFVSGAAGAVGSLAVQFARLLGAGRVVGSAGSAEKVGWVTGELGADAAFNYHDGAARDLLTSVAPEGIDVYFDNVGGEQLEAAIGRLRLHGRIAVCGLVSAYNATEPPAGPRNLARFIQNRLTMRGFLVSDHADLRPAFIREVGGWYAEGRLVWKETVIDGLENAVEAFRGVLTGANTGKMLVRLDR